MKRIILLLSVFLGCMSLVNGQIDTAPEKYGFKVWKGMTCPDFEVQMLDGKVVKLKDLKGKVVLIDFSGTQCGGCIAGMKKFKTDIFERFKGEDLVVLPIFVKYKDLEDVKKLCERMGFDFPVAVDKIPNVVAPLFYTQGIPRYFVVGRDGKIVYHGPDYTPDAWKVMLESITKALKEKK